MFCEWCAQGRADTTIYNQCFLANAYFFGTCCLPQKDRALLMLQPFSQRCYLPIDMPQLILSVVSQCCLIEEHRPLLMLPNVGLCKGHSTDAHTLQPMHAGLLLMLHSIGQHCFPDAHMPCLMHIVLGCCCLPLADIAFPKNTRLG